MVIGHVDVTKQAGGGHVASRATLHCGFGDDAASFEVALGVGVWCASKLFAVAWAEVQSEFADAPLRVMGDDDAHAKVRSTVSLRCFEIKVDGRGPTTKYSILSKEMHLVPVSLITGITKLGAGTLDALKRALNMEKWKGDMFRGVDVIGDFIQEFNGLGDAGGTSQKNMVSKLNADAHHVVIKTIFQQNRDTTSPMYKKMEADLGSLRKLWLQFAFSETPAVVDGEFFNTMLRCLTADFVHYLKPEHVPGRLADLLQPRLGRDQRRLNEATEAAVAAARQELAAAATTPGGAAAMTPRGAGETPRVVTESPEKKKRKKQSGAASSPAGWRQRATLALKRVIAPTETWWLKAESGIEKPGRKQGSKLGLDFGRGGSTTLLSKTRTFVFGKDSRSAPSPSF